jgi:hypothetical protein
MIHIISPILMTLLIMRIKAVEQPGGCHGTDNKTDRYTMGAAGSSANEHGAGRCLFSQLHDYFDVRCRPVQSLDIQGSGLLYRYCGSCAEALPKWRIQSLAPYQAAGPAKSGQPRIYQPDETGHTNQSLNIGLWLFQPVGGEIGRASGQSNRDSVQRRSIAKTPTPRGFFHPSTQAYPQGQTGRTGIKKCQERPCPPKKKR